MTNFILRLKSIFLTFCLFGWTVLSCLFAFWFIYVQPAHKHWFLQKWASQGLKICGVKVKLIGQQHLPSSGCVFLFNHISLLDILVIFATIGPRLSNALYFGAKIELFRIPMFGFLIKRLGTLPIHRNLMKKTQQIYRSAVARLHAGESFFLSPEGGRSQTTQLRAFKSGPFLFALQAQAPLVPVVIVGLSQILPKQNVFLNLNQPCKVKVSILPATSTTGKNKHDRYELKTQIQKQFREELQRLQATNTIE